MILVALALLLSVGAAEAEVPGGEREIATSSSIVAALFEGGKYVVKEEHMSCGRLTAVAIVYMKGNMTYLGWSPRCGNDGVSASFNFSASGCPRVVAFYRGKHSAMIGSASPLSVSCSDRRVIVAPFAGSPHIALADAATWISFTLRSLDGEAVVIYGMKSSAGELTRTPVFRGEVRPEGGEGGGIDLIPLALIAVLLISVLAELRRSGLL